ncbi:MAG TPA: DnaJ domain-containing protein [Methylomirabilota bacterium]|jgi:curved DNA-binding protein CbpA|nr:DnaJ domain-containing protein [Methylomirabilota bacterium]
MRVKTERDYYAILGVADTATEEEIKRAYRRLALRYHPDRNRGDKRAEDRFKEISEAYAVLMDPGRRREYDGLRQSRAQGDRAKGPGWREEDLFRDLFTDPRTASVFDELAREWTRMGLRFNEAFLRDVFFRGQGVIVIGPSGIRWIGTFGPRAPAERVPETAHGSTGGDAVASSPGFLGWLWERVKETVGRPLTVLRQALALPAGGVRRGDLRYEIALPREDLGHGGRYRLTVQRAGRTEELLVRIPAGIREGTRLRLRGKGELGPAGTPGDLFLHVRVKA